MKTTIHVGGTSTPLALFIEYTDKLKPLEVTYRALETKFFKAFGYLPIHTEDQNFSDLTDTQQSACIAFWNHKLVSTITSQMIAAQAIADVMFDLYSNAIK